MDDFKVPLQPAAPEFEIDTGVADEVSKHLVKQIKMETEYNRIATNSAPTCPYIVPSWSAPPPQLIDYKFEVLKSGQIIEEVDHLQKKPVWKFGRLPPPANDLELAHPTISRFHAVLQYRPKKQNTDYICSDNVEADKDDPPEGWYIFDLNSTHGTFLNKQRIPPRIFIRIHVGHILRLGASSRSYILQGPVEDEEPETELSVTELREHHRQKLAEAQAEAKRKETEAVERERNESINWGMGEDADEESDLTHNPFASTNNEELFLDDPKKTLRGYFEREGLQLEYKCDEMSAGSFVCRVELPLDDAYGRPIVAEVVHKGRKKECVLQCALEACRILDRHGVLRQANQEPVKRKLKSGSDSDDDFLDRTGDVERKRQRKSTPSTITALTYEDLLKKSSEVVVQLEKVKDDILRYQESQRRLKATQAHNSDDLDHFMENLADDAPQLDKMEIRKLRLEEQHLQAEKQKIQRLLMIAKPIELQLVDSTQSLKAEVGAKKKLPIIGKRNQFSKFKYVKLATSNKYLENTNTNLASDEEEMEDDDKIQVKEATNVSHDSSKSDLDDKETSKDMEKFSTSENYRNKTYGPIAVPQLILRNNEDITANISIATNEQRSGDSNKEYKESENSKRKRRQRQRQRQKRPEIDIDELDAHESSEKYAKWIPPPNQMGDGYTELNEKYGY